MSWLHKHLTEASLSAPSPGPCGAGHVGGSRHPCLMSTVLTEWVSGLGSPGQPSGTPSGVEAAMVWFPAPCPWQPVRPCIPSLDPLSPGGLGLREPLPQMWAHRAPGPALWGVGGGTEGTRELQG